METVPYPGDGCRNAEVIEVIRTEALIGDGTQDDAKRTRTRYWSKDGELLAEVDPGE